MNCISDAELRGMLRKIIKEIEQSLWEPDYIFGISRGGLIPATYLSHRLNKPMRVITLSTRDFPEQNIPGEEIVELVMQGEKILIVDDIADSGKSINAIIDFVDECANNVLTNINWGVDVKFAVLQAKPTSDIKPEFIGQIVDSDEWQVYPWENL